MKTQITIPDGVHLADTQSELNFEMAANGEITSGLLVIEGAQATGKSRLAKYLIELLGLEPRIMFLPNEKSLDHIFNVEKSRFVFIDEVRTSRRPLDSAAMASAIENGALVILAGLEVDLSPNLETHAIRIRIGQNRNR